MTNPIKLKRKRDKENGERQKQGAIHAKMISDFISKGLIYWNPNLELKK